MNSKEYIPVSCRLYDKLELHALRNEKCTITFSDEKNKTATMECVITDLFSQNKVEYLKTSAGFILRLDKIIELNGNSFKKV